MAWKKYFTTVPSQARITARLEELNRESSKGATSQKFSSYLPEVYAGAPNRIERYVAYDQADLDSEINRSLDTIAEFCTQNQSDDDPIPFRFIWKGEVTETEVELLKGTLQQWCSINKLNKRIFKIFRNTIKYGDQFFIRDPETYELLWVDSAKVEKIIVNEAKGKKIEQYVIRDLDFNLQSLVATNPMVHDQYSFPGGYPRSANPASGAGNINYGQPTTPGGRTSRFYNPANSMAIDANHVVHLSLSEGMDQYWPFGTSVIEAVYKTYKQKDLLEDCILIYRIVRAPERRVFKIDVGQLQGQRAMQYVERVKNEIYQRRLPNRCLDLNTKIHLLDGRLLPLRDVIDEFDKGKTNWVYSCCPETGKIVPGKITWAGATRSQTQVVRLTLDNGHQITCTPDHKFPILGKGFVEAQNLEIGESFIPAYFREATVNYSKNPKKGYTQIFDPATKEWKFVHRMVAQFFKEFEGDACLVKEQVHLPRYKDRLKQTVHHRDFNRYNNNPENLAWMNSKDHICYHGDSGVRWRQWLNNEPNARAIAGERGKSNWKKFWNDPQKKKMALDARVIKYNTELFDLMLPIIQSQETVPTLSRCVQILNKNKKFLKAFKNANSGLKNPGRVYRVTSATVLGILRTKNIKTYTQFANTYCADQNDGDMRIYKYSNTLLHIFKSYYMSLKEASLLDLVDHLKRDAEFMNEFNALHTNHGRSPYVCYAYVRGLLWHYGYPSFNHFKAVYPQKGRYQHARPGLRSYQFSREMFGALRSVYQTLKQNIHYTQKTVGFKRLYPALQKNADFIAAFKQANTGASKSKFGPDLVRKLLESQGFDTYEKFVEDEPYLNHKLVSIEWVSDLCDTGTITVDGDEIWHNYHTFAIEGGIFTKNSGGGASILDTSYNPISITEDIFLATNSEQRGTTIDTLPSGDNLGQIDDLKYFNNKLMRGLGIPSSYLPTGPDDGTAVYNDGKVGTAFIQEYRFNKYCQRLQTALGPTLDMEFKLFLKFRGIEVHSSLFELAFNVPQSFSEYRNMALDTERVNLFSSVMNSDANKYMSKRYALGRYLGWTEEDILENERMWKEENANRVKGRTGTAPIEDQGVGLGSIGIRPGPEPEFGAPELPETPGGEEEFATPAPGPETSAGGAPAGETPPPTAP